MGDARTVVQLRKDDKRDKKAKAAPAAEPARAPAKAVEDPSAALEQASGVDLSGFAETLLAALQEAGGNLAVQDELAGLEQGIQAASKAAQDKAAFDSMTDMQKVAKSAEKHGGKLPEPSGRKAPAPGEPPPGMEPPAKVTAFHTQRAAEMTQLAGVYTQMTTQASLMANNPALDEATRAAFVQASAQYGQMSQEYMNAAARYSAVAADMATNEFAGLAVPPSTVGAVYQARVAALTLQQNTLAQAAAAQIEQGAKAQAERAGLEAELAELTEQQAALEGQAAESSEGAGGDAGGGGGAASSPHEQIAQLTKRRAALEAKLKGTATRAEASQTVSQALTATASQLGTLISAYNSLLASSAATPTGRPTKGGGGK